MVDYSESDEKSCRKTLRAINSVLCRSGKTKRLESMNIDFYIFLSMLQHMSNETVLQSLLTNETLQSM